MNVFEGDELGDYENPPPPDQLSPKIPPRPAAPPIWRRSYPCEKTKVVLPLAKQREEDVFTKIREKARLGFDKVHEQLLRRVKMVQRAAEKKVYGRSMSDNGPRESTVVEKKRLSKSVSMQGDTTNECQHSQRFSRACRLNKDRPLPGLPTKISNVTDDDKQVVYDEAFAPTEYVNYQDKVSADANDTLARLPDLHKVGKADQTTEDFHSYTVEELVECLKACRLEKFAMICNENRLDGAFFKDFELNQLESEPFCLSKLDVMKFKKIIKDGWRPKTRMP